MSDQSSDRSSSTSQTGGKKKKRNHNDRAQSEVRLPRLDIYNKSIFDGVEGFFKEAYISVNREKPINFTSRKYKSYIKLNNDDNRKGFQRLSQAIKESYQTVNKVKRGYSLQEQKHFNTYVNQQTLPIFENQKMRGDLQQYLDCQVNEYTQLDPRIKARTRNLDKHNSIHSQNSANAYLLPDKKNKIGQRIISNTVLKVQSNSQVKQKMSRNSLLQNQQSISSNPYQNQTMNCDTIDPQQQQKELQQKFDFPLNPAFFHSSIVKQPKKLVSLDVYCKDKEIAVTKHQSVQYTLQKIKKEHRFWNEQFQKIVKGYRDNELDDRVIQCIIDLDYAGLSEAEKELIFSKELGMTNIGRVLKKNVEQYLEETKSRKYQHNNTVKLENKQSFTELNNVLKDNSNFSIQNIKNILLSLDEKKDKRDRIKIRQRPLKKQQPDDLSSNNRSGRFNLRGDESKLRHDIVEELNSESSSSSKSNINLNESVISKQNQQVSTPGEPQSQLGKKFKISLKKRIRQLLQEQKRKAIIVEDHNSQISMMKNQLKNMILHLEKIEQEEKRRKVLKQYKTVVGNQEEEKEAFEQFIKKYFNKRNKPIANLISTTDKINSNNKFMSDKLHKMIDRLELDRPLLFKEKIKTLWGEKPELLLSPNQSLLNTARKHDMHSTMMEPSIITQDLTDRSNTQSLRVQLEARKLQRMRKNINQKEAYKKILHQVSTRRQDSMDLDLTAEEIRILNLMKIILDGGWTIEADVFHEMLEIAGILEVMKEYNEKQEAAQGSKEGKRDYTILKNAEMIAQMLGLYEFKILKDNANNDQDNE